MPSTPHAAAPPLSTPLVRVTARRWQLMELMIVACHALVAMPLAYASSTPAATPAASAASATEGDWRAASPIKVKTGKSTADHSKFKELHGPFKSGEEITKACLSCHTEAARQVMDTRHWTWEYTNPDTGQKLGKKTMVNAFCIGDRSNEAFCQTCHVGYGWKDKTFDFNAENKVDCLVCHHTGGYKKQWGTGGEVQLDRLEEPAGSGKFIEPVDLAMVAQHIGKTSTETCGTCHYNGGGGDGVKHGDLDSSLNHADRALDVHMASKEKGGAGFSCATCHQSDAHALSGSRIQMTAVDAHGPVLRGGDMHGRKAATCQSCHGNNPHKESFLFAERLNQHTSKLACQSCHIPSFARGGVSTKMRWDWSQAGRHTGLGQPVKETDEHGHVIYDGRKGRFVLGHDVVPDYVWFNGKVRYTTQEDPINPDEIVQINQFLGEPGEPNARIWPVKRFNSTQPYDKVSHKLLVPHVSGGDKETSFWHVFDWNKSLAAGAEATGVPYSGQHGFVRSQMLWPITHMVAPKEQAVSCTQCHSANSRLKGLPGLYLPARDQHPWIDRIGWLAVLLATAGVLVHAAIRLITRRKTTAGSSHA